MKTLERLIEHHAGSVLLAFALLAAGLAALALQVRIAPGLEELLIAGDPELVRNDEVKEDFSNDEILVLGYELGRAVDLDALELLASVREQIEQIEGVDEVIDLTNVEDVRADASDPTFLDASPLLPAQLGTGDVRAMRARARNHPLYEGSLISEDQTVVATVVLPEVVLADDPRFEAQAELNAHLVSAIYDTTRDLGIPVWIAGYPAAELESTTIVLRDLVVLTSVAIVLILGVLWLFVRRVWALGVLLAVVVWTEVVALAWQSLSGTPLTVVLSTLPTILLATSGTYALYMINLLPGVSTDDPPGVGLLRLSARSCALSAVSTGAGFLALLVMPVPSIRDLGLSLAVGILGCLVASLLLVPALVQRFELRLERLPFPGLSRLSLRGVRWAERPWRTVVVALPLAALAIAGIPKLVLESDPLTFWKPDHYHRQSDVFLQEHLGGSLFLHAVLSTDVPGEALDSDVLRYAQSLLDRAETSPVVARSLSLLDYFELIDDVMDPDGGRRYLDDNALAAQYMILYENSGDPDDLRHYVDFDRSALNLVLRVNSRSSSDILQLRDELLAFSARQPDGVRTEILGTWLLFPKAMDSIARGMVQGLLLALAAIFTAMVVFLRSPRLAALAMIPNTLPILVCLGVLGWLGVPLSFATAIVGCVALGLAVDDTAHVLGHLHPGDSLEHVYGRVGRALFVTTACLGAGFLALGLSGFLPLVHFGIATTLSLLVAFVADLFLLPSLLRLAGLVPEGSRRSSELPQLEGQLSS